MILSFDLYLERLVDFSLEEDIGPGDITTQILVPEDLHGSARIVAKEDMVVSGLDVAHKVFKRIDAGLEIETLVANGDFVLSDSSIIKVCGSLSSILTCERTVLNFLQRLCGIATCTKTYVKALEAFKTKLLDTRKTTPGLRFLEKRAVRHGGGTNHRMALFDGILIKDNHISAVGDLEKAIRMAKEKAPLFIKIEVEVENLEGLKLAIEAGADLVLLDNMEDEILKEAVEIANGRVLLEASGGITLERLPVLGALGIDFISCGVITHSARAVDLSLEL